MTTNAATTAKQRAVLREVDLKLMSVAFDVESTEAAALVGRARAEIRAAEQLLGAAARECCDPPVHCTPPATVIANVSAIAAEAVAGFREGLRR